MKFIAFFAFVAAVSASTTQIQFQNDNHENVGGVETKCNQDIGVRASHAIVTSNDQGIVVFGQPKIGGIITCTGGNVVTFPASEHLTINFNGLFSDPSLTATCLRILC